MAREPVDNLTPRDGIAREQVLQGSLALRLRGQKWGNREFIAVPFILLIAGEIGRLELGELAEDVRFKPKHDSIEASAVAELPP